MKTPMKRILCLLVCFLAVATAPEERRGEAPDADAPPTDKPAWLTSGVRVTATDPADLTMSGDHRKY